MVTLGYFVSWSKLYSGYTLGSTPDRCCRGPNQLLIFPSVLCGLNLKGDAEALTTGAVWQEYRADPSYSTDLPKLSTKSQARLLTSCVPQLCMHRRPCRRGAGEPLIR
jgi:hypothetical protein